MPSGGSSADVQTGADPGFWPEAPGGDPGF